MSDLTSAVHLLDKIPHVLGIRYSTLRVGCIVRVLRDTSQVREQIEEVLRRYSTPYIVELVHRSKEHIEAVSRFATESKASRAKNILPHHRLPSHAHRVPRGKQRTSTTPSSRGGA